VDERICACVSKHRILITMRNIVSFIYLLAFVYINYVNLFDRDQIDENTIQGIYLLLFANLFEQFDLILCKK
jgi:hypothetical protein